METDQKTLEMAINTELVGTLARQAKHNIRLSNATGIDFVSDQI
jgi:hypothetical protein